METLAQKNERIGKSMAIGEIRFSYSCENGDFYFKTKEQGCVLIRKGKNILLPFQDGKVSHCLSHKNGDFSFLTAKQGWCDIAKEAIEE